MVAEKSVTPMTWIEKWSRMNKMTIMFRDDKKRDELLKLITALPYVESVRVDGSEEVANGHYAQAQHEVTFGVDDEESPFY